MRGPQTPRGTFPYLDPGPLPTPTAGAVIDRMRIVVGVATDIELAEKLNLGRSAPSNWRSRNKVPVDACFALAVEHGVSLDWLLFGVGGLKLGAHPEQISIANDTHPGHLVLERLRGFDSTPGPQELIFPELVIRQRMPHGDVGALRWMVNPSDAFGSRLPQGALLLVDSSVNRHEDVVDGETYVVRMWGRTNVRRVTVIGRNEYRLSGDDGRKERRDITGPDSQHLEVGGRVIDVI